MVSDVSGRPVSAPAASVTAEAAEAGETAEAGEAGEAAETAGDRSPGRAAGAVTREPREARAVPQQARDAGIGAVSDNAGKS